MFVSIFTFICLAFYSHVLNSRLILQPGPCRLCAHGQHSPLQKQGMNKSAHQKQNIMLHAVSLWALTQLEYADPKHLDV